MERPGIITEYQYEGIAWIKETSKYYMIFWNRSLAIPVEKAGFYRGKKETFGGFLEKRCNKVIDFAFWIRFPLSKSAPLAICAFMI